MDMETKLAVEDKQAIEYCSKTKKKIVKKKTGY